MKHNHPKIEIMDTTLRDGEQTSGVSFVPHEKLMIARLLLEDLKADRVEVASARVSEGEFDAVKMICDWAARRNMLPRVEVLGFVDGHTSVDWIHATGCRVINLLCKGSLKHCSCQLKKSPEEHIEAQNDLCQRTEHRKVPRRANEAEARADVRKHGPCGADGVPGGESRQKQNGCADHEGREPDHEVGQHGDADFFVDRRLVERERNHRLRIKQLRHFPSDHAEDDQQAHHLDAAARRACARRERCGDQQEDGQAERPGGVVDRCVARRRDDGDH